MHQLACKVEISLFPSTWTHWFYPSSWEDWFWSCKLSDSIVCESLASYSLLMHLVVRCCVEYTQLLDYIHWYIEYLQLA